MAELTVPRLDFSALGELPDVYRNARTQATREMTLANLGRDGNPNYEQAAASLLRGGDLAGGMQLAQLGKALRPEQTELQKNYRAAVDQGFKGTILDYDLTRKRAGATNVHTNVNTAEGFGAAQTKARITADTDTLKEVSKIALSANRLRPLLDEVERLADKTPEGVAGPISAMGSRIASGFGIEVPEGWSNAELLQSISQRLVPIVREPGPTSEKELGLYLQAVPGLMQSAEGRKKVARMTRAVGERANLIAKTYRQHIGSPDLYDRLSELDKPIFDPNDLKGIPTASTPSSSGSRTKNGVNWRIVP